ncbi:hypothetical protein [Argonema galeatum]|uniref:hypothetical protein n=1 Tax=Argonema galeatum TaxID=2942762 RepID=UPI002011185D|nr:hypothetical protein [Argonema galeatum]MCL1466446.1 hypothetical protein [Argonema galeatum A003/A1]
MSVITPVSKSQPPADPPAMPNPLSYRAAVQVHAPKQPPVASLSALALIVE